MNKLPHNPKFPWRTVAGTDFAREILRAKAQDDVSFVWSAFDHILIVSHTGVQKDLFWKNWRMPREKITHVVIPEQLYGRGGKRTVVFCLPDWDATHGLVAHAGMRRLDEMRYMLNTITAHEVTVVDVTEEQVLRTGKI